MTGKYSWMINDACGCIYRMFTIRFCRVCVLVCLCVFCMFMRVFLRNCMFMCVFLCNCMLYTYFFLCWYVLCV